MKTFCKIVWERFSAGAASTLLFLLFFTFAADAQKRRRPVRPITQNRVEKSAFVKYRTPVPAIVVTEKLAVLRFEPSLAAISIQRMRTGRNVLITGERQTPEGLTFFRVSLPPDKSGWVQAEAIASHARRGDDERVARLIRAADEFDQLELATVFLENFPKSVFRPAILLLAGDLAEEAAQRLSRNAARRIDADEITASGAPVHSFYYNFNELDRYRKLGVNFVFDLTVKQFHYNGAAWREILQKHPDSGEAAEARKRLDSFSAPVK